MMQLYSWHKLAKLCQQLEVCAKAENILSYVLTSSSIKFDLHMAIKFLMEKHGFIPTHILLATSGALKKLK